MPAAPLHCAAMAKQPHVFETPATQWLKRHGTAFSEHVGRRGLGLDR
jgi:hypothetical protein